MTRRIPLALSVLSLAALGAAPAAQAGTAFQFATGQKPHTLLDPASGLAHVVWSDDPDTQGLRYCQIPRGATACQNPRDLVLPDVESSYKPDRGYLLRDPGTGTLYVIAKRYVGSDTWAFTSTNGGATWSAAVKIYSSGTGTDLTEPVLGPVPGNVTVGSWNPAMYAFTAPLGGGLAGTTTIATVSSGAVPSLVYDFQVATTGDGGLVGTANSLDKTYAWRVAPAGNPSASGDWGAPALVGDGADSRLAGGPSGAFSLLVVGVLNPQVIIRRWQSATTFGAGVSAATEGAREPDIGVGPSGAVVGVWRLNTTGNYQMRAVVSTTAGATFSAPYTFSDDPGLALDPQVGLAQDNEGLVVWQSAGKALKAATLSALPAPTPTPSPGPGTPPPAGSGSPATRRVVSSVPGASITFGVPKGCVQPGSTFRVTLSWKRKKRKGNKFVKVTRADFSVGAKVVKSDRRAPFVQTLRVTASARRGSTISLRARAFIKVRKGKAPKKSIRASIKVCP